MPTRKFFLGDLVQIAGNSHYASKHSYSNSDDADCHRGVITKTTIGKRSNNGWRVLYYTIECECGQQIHPQSNDLNLVATPSDNAYAPVTSEHRLFHLLYRAGIPEHESVSLGMSLHKQVNMLLEAVRERERWILAMRFGIPIPDDGESPRGDLYLSRTLADIATELGLTRQRISQLEQAGFSQMRRAWATYVRQHASKGEAE